MLSKQDIELRAHLWNRTYDYLREFFTARGYTEVRTPLLVRTPGMEPNLDPIGVEVKTDKTGESYRGGLITSPEYSMKKLLGGGMEKIYTVTPVFRNCEKLGQRWSVEFTMLEWYRQGADYTACMEETEELINGLLGWTEKWQRISYVDEFEKILGYVPKEGSSEEIDRLFYDKVWPNVKKEERYFLYQFPIPCASLSKVSADGRYAERFEGFVGEMEMCNAFTELVDTNEQRRRFLLEQEERRMAGKEVFPIDEELLSRLSSVASPTYGNALGIDRLVMLLAGVKDIDSVHLFPPSTRF